VILITGYGSVETAINALRSDAIDYILKPFEDEELLERIRRVIERQQMGQKAAKAEMYESVVLALGAVAHELNNPLMIISLNAELLLSEINESHPMYESIKAIQESADRMAFNIQKMREIRDIKTKLYTKDSKILDIQNSNGGNSRRDKNVLIVDDEAMIRSTLCKMLMRNGYTVAEASCGAEALELLTESEFDYIFLDVSMPDLDGYETLLRIKNFFASKNAPMTKVIMMTGYDVSSILEKCLEEGAVLTLKKPMKLSGVLEVLAQI